MAKSSINFQKASINSKAHMLRISKVTYLLDNENSKNVFKEYLDANTFLEQAKIITKEKTKRSMQKLAIENFIQEAVLNIKEHTSIKDIENLFKKFNKEFGGGFKVFDIALHKDEGVFIDSKFNIDDLVWDSKSLKWFKENEDVTNEVFAIAPGRDIFYNADDKSWYKEKDFKQKIDTTKYQKFYNYHSHIRFTKFDENNGKNIRLSKSDLSKIQDITAKHLDMERGEKWSKNKRMTHWQKKALYDENTKQKALKQATQKDLKTEIATLRAELKENKANRSDYAQLEQKKKELEEQIKKKNLTIEELKEQVNKLQKEFNEHSRLQTKLSELLGCKDNALDVFIEVKQLAQQEQSSLKDKIVPVSDIKQSGINALEQMKEQYHQDMESNKSSTSKRRRY